MTYWHSYTILHCVREFCLFETTLELINNDLDIELNKKRRDTKLTTRRFEDILSSLSSDRKNSVLKFKGVNIQYVNLHEQFRP